MAQETMLVARWMQSKYMYSITQKGEYFTKAMLNEFGLPSGPPATAAFMNADMREFGVMGIESPATRNLTSNPFKGIDEEQLFDWIMTAHVGNVKTFSIPKDRRKALHTAAFMNADMREFGVMGIESPATRNLTSNPFKGIDEEQLFDWIMTAHVGNVKTFSIPKDRRKALHDACDKYQLNMPGLKLIHSSAGTGCQRALQVRMISKAGSSSPNKAHMSQAVTFLPDHQNSAVPNFALSASTTSKRVFSGDAFTLGGSSPTKQKRITPGQAAAYAAIARQAGALETKAKSPSFVDDADLNWAL